MTPGELFHHGYRFRSTSNGGEQCCSLQLPAGAIGPNPRIFFGTDRWELIEEARLAAIADLVARRLS